MGLRRRDPLLVAAIVAGISVLCWGIVGTKDLEEQFNGAFSYAASFRESVFSKAPEFGKHTLFGVPVYDTSVGLGYRLPFLYGTSHSPFVFLRYFLTTQAIQFVVVAISSLSAMVSLNFMYKSWLTQISRSAGLVVLVLLDIGVLGPATIYLYVNEWSTQAAQYFGALTIASSLFEKTWFCERSIRPLQIPRIQITLIIGLIFLFIGHQGNIPNFVGLIVIPAIFHLYSRKIAWQDRKFMLYLFGTLVSVAVPNALDVIVESTKQPFARITAVNWYSFSLNVQEVLYFFKQLIYGNSWPISSFLRLGFPNSDAESSKGFFGLFSIVIAISGIILIRIKRPLDIAFMLMVSCFLVVVVQSATQGILGVFESSAAWQLRDTLFIISTLMAVLFMAALTTTATKQITIKIWRAGTIIVVCLSAFFTFAVIGIQAKNAGYTNGLIPKVISQENSDWIEILSGVGVEEGDRIYIANPDLFRYANWSGYEKLPQFVDLKVSTINGWPKIRSAFTLAKNQAGIEARFFNVIDSRFGCRPNELEFLAVDWVIDSNGECHSNYLNKFSQENVKIFKIGSNAGIAESKNVYLYKIIHSKIYTVNHGESRKDESPCALLVEDNCLGKLGAESEIIGAKYFNLCLRTCIAEFHWYSNELVNDVLVPMDFQPFLKAVNNRTNEELEASSLNGLLKIDLGWNSDYGDLITISMKPDQIMYVSAIATWVSTMSLILPCFVFVVKQLMHKKHLRAMREGI